MDETNDTLPNRWSKYRVSAANCLNRRKITSINSLAGTDRDCFRRIDWMDAGGGVVTIVSPDISLNPTTIK
jgi:hypothetical protein